MWKPAWEGRLSVAAQGERQARAVPSRKLSGKEVTYGAADVLAAGPAGRSGS
jgi:hypothetical protein